MPFRWSRLTLALGLVALATVAHAAFAPGDNVRSLQSGGLTRMYRVHAPPGFNNAAPVPLVVDIHGLGSNASQQEGISGMKTVSDAEGFLVAYPDGIDNTWNAGTCCGNLDIDDVAFFRDLVAAIEAEAPIDRSRVYATGLSNGGAMSQRLACDAADLFAAAAPMAFPIPRDPRTECLPSRSMPVLTVMGLTDQLVRYDGQAFGTAPDTFAYWHDVNACSGDPVRVDHGPSRCETYTTCENGVQVELCSVVAQAFPGSPFSGHILYLQNDFVLSNVAWQFLSQFTLPEDAAALTKGQLTGPDHIKITGTRGRGRLAPLTWTVALGDGTWGATAGGTVISGSWQRARHGRTGKLELTTDGRQQLEDLVAIRAADLTSSAGLEVALEQKTPLRVSFDKAGVPTSLRGKFRILSAGEPAAPMGRYELRLHRVK